MSKWILSSIILIGAVLVAAVTGLALSSSSDPGPGATPSGDAAPNTSSTAEAGDSLAPGPGRYVDYSATAIAEAEGRVLLFFHAPWCPQCLAIENDIETEGAPHGVTIVKVDYDSNQDLRLRYGVTLQTTFVEVDPAGAELQKHVGYDNPRLSAIVEAML